MYRVILTRKDLGYRLSSIEEIIDKIRSLDFNSIGISVYANTNKEKRKTDFVASYIKYEMKKNGFILEDLRNPEFLYSKEYSLIRHILKQINNPTNELVATQGLLQFLKYMYLYNSTSNDHTIEDQLKVDENILNEVIEVQLMINDYIQIEVEDTNLLQFMMIKFNSEMNLKGLLARTWCVYCKLSIDKKALGIVDKQFLDFNSDFFKEYTFEIEELLAVYFYSFAQFYQDSDLSPYINIDSHFEKAKSYQKCTKVLQSLVCKYEDFKDYSSSTINKSFDFEILTKTPLLELRNGVAMIPSKAHLQAYLLNNFRKKMESMYNVKGNKFTQFLGFPFETYVKELCEQTIVNTDIYGKSEFNIKGDYKSSEFYMRCGNSMIIVEVKSKDIPREKIFCNYDSKMVYGLVEDQFIDPVFQIDRSIQAILDTTYKGLFDNVNEIIGIVVTFENVHLSIDEYQNYAINEITSGKQQLKTREFRYFINLGIEEFECLCWLIESKYDAFILMKEYYAISDKQPFYNFLSSKNIKFEVVPSFTNSNWDELNRKMMIFFGV